MSRWLTGLTVLLAAALALTMRCCTVERAAKREAEQDRSALLGEVRLWQTQYNRSAASVEALTLQRNELERYRHEYDAVLRELNIRKRRTESLAQTVSQLTLELAARLEPDGRTFPGTTTDETSAAETYAVPETLFTPGAYGTPDTAATGRRFYWQDTWVRVEGAIEGDSVRCAVHSADTLTQVIHRVPRRFLFFRWGTRAIRQEVVSSNPHNRIVYTEYIRLRR